MKTYRAFPLAVLGVAFFHDAIAEQAVGDVIAGPVVNPANGHSYVLLTPDTWSNSEAAAVNLGGHLVTVDDEAENEWLLATFGNHGGRPIALWTGLTDLVVQGVFAWSGGSRAEFRNWAPGYPAAGGGRDRVGVISAGESGIERGKWILTGNSGTGGRCHGVVELAPAVSNVRAVLRPGTKLVDIDYDVSGATAPVGISVEVPGSDGSMRRIPPAALQGAVGVGVRAGSNLRVTWDTTLEQAGVSLPPEHVMIAINDNPLPAGLAFVPAGSFEMGFQPPYQRDKDPPRTVKLSGYFISRYEITNGLWDHVREWAQAHGYEWLSWGVGVGGERKSAIHPVTSIRWYDAVSWCNARSEMEGFAPCYTISGEILRTASDSWTDKPPVECDWKANGYRLPTEAEWERAARGGLVGTKFPWGGTIGHENANYQCDPADWVSLLGVVFDVSETRGYHPDFVSRREPYTSPVGSFLPNGFGLYDVAGNATEWCWDWHDVYSSGDIIDPKGAARGEMRIFRGGGWLFSAQAQFCGWRGWIHPINPFLDGRQGPGFRIVRGRL